MNASYIPNELLNIILEYDGRIKYKNGQYINIIHTNDERYTIITPIIHKKIEIILKKQIISYHYGLGFLFAVRFNISNSVGLLYDYNYSYMNQFEICYYDSRNYDMSHFRIYL